MNTLSFIPPFKKRNVIDHRRQQFTDPAYAADSQREYQHRLNMYARPPTADITLEEFEQWAIDRLRVIAELEACSFRNRSPAETAAYMKPLLDKYLPLDSNSSASNHDRRQNQRRKDHYSHFILRLAFCATEDLRRRFVRVETMLFRMRMMDEGLTERHNFVDSLSLDWEDVEDIEKHQYSSELAAISSTGGRKGGELGDSSSTSTSWKKVGWERVPELVEQRRVFVRRGKAYVPGKEQIAMVVSEFSTQLEKYLEVRT